MFIKSMETEEMGEFNMGELDEISGGLGDCEAFLGGVCRMRVSGVVADSLAGQFRRSWPDLWQTLHLRAPFSVSSDGEYGSTLNSSSSFALGLVAVQLRTL